MDKTELKRNHLSKIALLFCIISYGMLVSPIYHGKSIIVASYGIYIFWGCLCASFLLSTYSSIIIKKPEDRVMNRFCLYLSAIPVILYLLGLCMQSSGFPD